MNADKKGLIVVMGGTTGAGKTVVVEKLLQRFPNSARVVTTTSRPKRLAEKDGIDYHFIDNEEFKRRIDAGEMLEYTYIENRDAYYGTRKSDFIDLLKNHDIVFFNSDHKGREAVAEYFPDNSLSIFLAPEDLKVIRQRLKARQPHITPEELDQRLENAANELAYRDDYDAVIVNEQGKLEETVKTAQKLILEALG